MVVAAGSGARKASAESVSEATIAARLAMFAMSALWSLAPLIKAAPVFVQIENAAVRVS
jgi:hypothetical protein